jgi:heme iron utilization protein
MAEGQDATVRQHAYTGPQAPAVPEPSYAERVRTLIAQHAIGTLATISRKREGFPFGSLMPYAVDAAGRPVFFISSMAMHTQNLKADARSSLFVAQGTADEDPLGAARATLVGEVRQVSEGELAGVRQLYLAAHENSRHWVDFADFAFYRLEVEDIYYVGGFGVMGWVEARDYREAEADPLAGVAAGIVAHMNEDHVEAMILLAHKHAGLQATDAVMTAVDRLGFHLRLTTAEGMKGIRINFPGEVRTAEETRRAMVALVKEANG